MSKYIGSSAVNLSTTSADVTGNADIDGNLTVGGNLTVSGTTITVDHASAQTVDLGDGDKIRLGADYELQLWSDGTTGRISGDINHTGSLVGVTQMGIGTSSPTNAIDVRGQAVFGSGTDGVKLTYSAGNSTGIIDTGFTSTGLEFRISNTEAMRIDSSGNLLVGVTSLTGASGPRDTSTTAGLGVGLNHYGGVYAAGYQASPFVSNRISNDGELFTFKKDGSTVGGIGAHESHTYIGTGDTGIYFNAGNDSVDPYNPSTPINRDNAISLGAASRRFKDLYLSNAIRLGDATLQEINGTDPFLSGNAYYNGSTWNYLTSTDATNYYQSDGQHIWRKAASGTAGAAITWSEAMRLDSSKALHIGTDSAGSYPKTGHSIRGGDSAIFSRTGTTGETMQVRRENSTGDFVRFYSGASTISGGIKVDGGSMVIGGGDVGIGYYQGANALVPYNYDNLAVRDAEIDLGYPSTFRWKDLYLSGGVFLGGTTNSNKLDDYEFGTWTPTLPNGGSVTVNGAFYTKVGQQVHIQAQCSFTPTNDSSIFRIGGVPFVSKAGASTYSAGSIGYSASLNTSTWSILTEQNNGNNLYFHNLANGDAITNSSFGGTTYNLIFSVTYITNA